MSYARTVSMREAPYGSLPHFPGPSPRGSNSWQPWRWSRGTVLPTLSSATGNGGDSSLKWVIGSTASRPPPLLQTLLGFRCGNGGAPKWLWIWDLKSDLTCRPAKVHPFEWVTVMTWGRSRYFCHLKNPSYHTSVETHFSLWLLTTTLLPSLSEPPLFQDLNGVLWHSAF